MDKITKLFIPDTILYADDLNNLVNKVNELVDAYNNGSVIIPVNGVAINYKPTSIVDTYQLTAVLTPSNTTQTGVTWSSSNPSVATVSSSGLVTVISAGSVIITLTSSSNTTISDSATIVASRSGKLDQTVTMDTIASKTIVSDDFTVSAVASSGLSVTYSSSNTSVATIDSTGLIHIVGIGSVVISATQPGNDVYKPASISKNLVVSASVASNLIDTELLGYGDSIMNDVGASSSANAWWQKVVAVLGITTSTKRSQAGCTVQEAYTTTERNSLEDRLITIGDYRFPKYTGAQRYCVVSLGMNDANNTDSTTNPPATFKEAYRTQLLRLINIGKYPANKIVLCNISPAKTTHGITQRIEDLNVVIHDLATELGLIFVDIYTPLKNGGGDSLLGDNLHPNDAGHALIASTVTSALGVTLTAPTVFAGDDITIQLPTTTTTVSGTVTTHNGSTVASILWEVVSGSITVDSPTSLTSTVSGASASGQAILKLTVIDSNGLSSYDTLIVTINASTELTALAITGASSIQVGGTTQLTAVLTPSNTTQTGVTWSSSNPSVATVSSSGLVTAIAAGSFTVTLTSTANSSIYTTKAMTASAAVSALDTYISTAGITDSEQVSAVTNLYNSLVSAGVYAKLWGLWLPLGTLSAAQKYNFINPGGTQVTWINDDSAAHTAKGFLSDKTTSRYGNTGLSVTADMLSGSNGMFLLADNREVDSSNTEGVMFGSYRVSGAVTQVSRNYSIKSVLFGVNNSGVSQSYPARNSYTGPVAGNYRVSDNIIQLWEGTTLRASAAQTTTPSYTNEHYIGAHNYNNAPLNVSNIRIGTCALGKALTDTEMTALMTAINTFNLDLGI